MAFPATVPGEVTTSEPPPLSGRRRRWWLRFVPAVPIIILAVFVLAGIFAGVLTDHGPTTNDLANSRIPPRWVDGGQAEYLLGTDSFGRDVFTRLLYGARSTLLIVVLSLAIAAVIGAVVGIVAGYVGGWVDASLMRLVDIMLGLPPFLIALVAALAFGPSLRNTIVILGLLIWPNIARLIRAETLRIRTRDFVRYSAAVGVRGRNVLRTHVFPNVVPTLLIALTLEVSNVILTSAALSFLGAGVPPPEPSWGGMIDEGRALISSAWWIALFPGLALTLTVISSNTLGDWLRDHLDPRTRGT